jgi:hypothetical protein
MVCSGVLRVMSLRTLDITFAASVELPAQTAKAFEEQLKRPHALVAIRSVWPSSRAKPPRQKFEKFSRAMGWNPDRPGTF